MNLFLGFIEGIGGPELLFIMLIVLLLFGANRLPELARGMGRAIREFKKATSGVEQEVRRAMEEPPPAPSPQPAGTVQKQLEPAKSPQPPPPPTAGD